MQPGTANSGGQRQRNEAGNARTERARRRPRADDEGSGCSKAHAALHRAHRGPRTAVEAPAYRSRRPSKAKIARARTADGAGTTGPGGFERMIGSKTTNPRKCGTATCGAAHACSFSHADK
eukprot:scaffold19669_cov67-Phaeocystis_antarctica.AAC.1